MRRALAHLCHSKHRGRVRRLWIPGVTLGGAERKLMRLHLYDPRLDLIVTEPSEVAPESAAQQVAPPGENTRLIVEPPALRV